MANFIFCAVYMKENAFVKKVNVRAGKIICHIIILQIIVSKFH